jgi:hypothetical protein
MITGSKTSLRNNIINEDDNNKQPKFIIIVYYIIFVLISRFLLICFNLRVDISCCDWSYIRIYDCYDELLYTIPF